MTSTGLGDFKGTERFSVVRCLGSGAFGVVYEAFDRERRSRVALKTVRNADPAAIYRFKQEFRSLADVTHPNLVRLYELLSDGEQWFFSLELIDGIDFIEYVRGKTHPALSSPGTSSPGAGGVTRITPRAGTRSRVSSGSDSGRSLVPEVSPAPPLHLGRVRSGLVQMGEGLRALHGHGKLHRDIKPQNVLVAPGERVVILDFGLALELASESHARSSGMHAVGTPEYMSPEQARGVAVSEASDWYSVGTILYEALTGILPFQGPPIDVLMKKQQAEPAPPADLVEETPPELNDLCRDLLRIEPEDRPSGDEVLERLRGAVLPPVRGERRGARRGSTPSRAAALVGRERHLAALHEAFVSAQAGQAATVLLKGRSGMGKTTLIRQFLKEATERYPKTVVLRGRCFERESVPYKALDSLIDDLSQYLKSLPTLQVEALLPRDVLALARLFPVLRRVEAVLGARRRVLDIPDSQELRRRAFAALRELLSRLTDRVPLILTIDDLQWGDVDSGALLAELVNPPEAPPVVLMLIFRSDDAKTSPFLTSFERATPGTLGIERREIDVGPLSLSESQALAETLLASQPVGVTERAELSRMIAREAKGNPLLIDELVRFAEAEAGGGPGLLRTAAGDDLETATATDGSPADSGGSSFAALIGTRIARLPEDARALLSVLAIAASPIPIPVALSAAGLEDLEAANAGAAALTGTVPALSVLQAGRLVKTRRGRERDEIETFHDQIRQSVLGALALESRRAIHHRLARVLEATGNADPEVLAGHFLEAEELDTAAEYASKAAANATQALAFDQAARLYRQALQTRSWDVEETRRLRVALGDSLASAGCGAEAADAYLAAAAGAPSAEALEYRRRAAEQSLRSGHVDKGLAALRDVLSAVGLRLAASPKKALVSLLLRRLFIKFRGLGFVERDSTQIAAEELIRIDICWSVAIGLGIVDTIRGSEYQARHLMLALKAGEPYRVARALAVETGFSATSGGPNRERTAMLQRRAEALAVRVANPHARGLLTFISGLAAYLEGRWKDAFTWCEKADVILREECTGVAWELGSVHFYLLRSLFHLGRLNELTRRLPTYLKDVGERGDLYTETNLRTRLAYLPYLMADQPDAARDEIRQIVDRWSHQGFHLQHYFDLFGQTEIDLYKGDGEGAFRRVSALWPALTKSLAQRVQLIFIESYHLRARTALAAARSAHGARREELLSMAAKDAGRVAALHMPWGDPLARLIQAGAAGVKGDRPEAMVEVEAAEEGFRAVDEEIWAAAARRRRGELTAGDAGQRLVSDADEWMQGQGIKNPARIAEMLAPGFGS